MQRLLQQACAALRRAPSEQELLFQLDDQEPKVASQKAASTADAAPTAAALHLASLITPAGRRWNTLVRDVQEASTSSGAKDCMSLASKLCSTQRWQVRVRTAVGGASSGCDTEVFRALRHQHLVARFVGDELQTDFIVDPAFRDTFAMPHCTAEYAALLKAVIPEVFVGPMHSLVPVVQCLCVEMARSFKSSGLPLPPWRRPDAMLSRWAPRKSVDIACGASPEGMPRFSAPALEPSAMAAAVEAALGAPTAAAVAAVVTGFDESRRGSLDGDMMQRAHSSEHSTEDGHLQPHDAGVHSTGLLLSTSSSASLGEGFVCCGISNTTSRSESPQTRSPVGLPSAASFGAAVATAEAARAAVAAAGQAEAASGAAKRGRRRSLLSEGLLASPGRHPRGHSEMGCLSLGLRGASTASSSQSSIAHSVPATAGAQSGVLTMAPVHKGQPSICKVRVW